MIFSLGGPGVTEVLAAIIRTQIDLPMLLSEALQELGNEVAQQLGDAAPRGAGDSVPPEGDGDGPLADSFFVREELTSRDGVVALSVHTTQPTKLKFVTEGTGIYGVVGAPILPRRKKALYWPGADHPVKSVAGQPPNDFVSPIVDAIPDDESAFPGLVDEVVALLEGH